MVSAIISIVIIILITAFVCGMRFRLIQHRTTRKGSTIPSWLNSMIDYLRPQVLIWKTTSFIGMLMFCLRIYQRLSCGFVLLTLILSFILFIWGYVCGTSITSKIFSKKILKEYGEKTVKEC